MVKARSGTDRASLVWTYQRLKSADEAVSALAGGDQVDARLADGAAAAARAAIVAPVRLVDGVTRDIDDADARRQVDHAGPRRQVDLDIRRVRLGAVDVDRRAAVGVPQQGDGLGRRIVRRADGRDRVGDRERNR